MGIEAESRVASPRPSSGRDRSPNGPVDVADGGFGETTLPEQNCPPEDGGSFPRLYGHS